MSAAWTAKGLTVFAGEGALAVPIARVMPGPHAELAARLIAAAPELHDALREVPLADLRRTIARDPALAAEPAPAEAQRAMRLLASIHGLQMPPGGPRPDPFGGEGGMTHGQHPSARIQGAAKRRGRGRPQAVQATGLRQCAWWLMRKLPRFTIDDLLFTLADGSERDAGENLRKYIRSLERVGVLARLMRRAPGYGPTSNGRVIWRLAKDLGRSAPVWRGAQGVLWDPNSGQSIAPPADAAAAPAGEGEAKP